MSEGRGTTPRILVVDQDADLRDGVHGLLREHFDVTVVADGEAALAALRRDAPDLVLTNVTLPRLDGFGLLKAIRSDVTTSTIPVIMFSTSGSEEWKVASLERGADDDLVTPFSARDLTTLAVAHLALARLRREGTQGRVLEERGAELAKLSDSLQGEVAKRKRAEESLWLQIEVLQTIPAVAWTCTRDGRCDFANHLWLQITGQTLPFVVASSEGSDPDLRREALPPLFSALHPDDRPRVERLFWDGVRSGRAFAFEARYRHVSDGEYHWHFDCAAPLCDTHGTLVKFVGTSADVTELRRTQDALRESEARIQAFCDNSPTVIFQKSPEGRYLYVNKEFERAVRLSRDQIIGRMDEEVFPPEIAAAFRANDQRVLAAGAPMEFEEMALHEDGPHTSIVHKFPLTHADGRIYALGGIATDITERKRAHEEVERSRKQLELENAYLHEQVKEGRAFGEMVGDSASLRKVLEQIEMVAPTDAAVLITGESGTGKELVARAIHDGSLRHARRMVTVNCASVPRELFESEFFGHVKGAFTGALRDRSGRFQLADSGTIFLDEVTEIPFELQGKLLRVLEGGHVERVGEDRARQVDVRVIAATNRDPQQELNAGRFRRDLYYRLCVFPIELPPLRERRGDIPLLADHFLQRVARHLNRPDVRLTDGALALLESYDWPGNIRELFNVIERAVILSPRGPLRIDLVLGKGGPRSALRDSRPPSDAYDRRVMRQEEMTRRDRDNVIAALERTHGQIYGSGGAAQILGLKPTTLASRLKRLGIARPAKP